MQLIAMVTMLIDHIGLILFPGEEIFRLVGRIAFPLYSWFLVQGYKFTSDHKKYMLRLLGLACISQIPYTLALQQWELNVIYTLLISLIAFYAIDQVSNLSLKTLIIIGVFTMAIVVPMDYGIYGFMLIFILRYSNGLTMVGLHMFLNFLFFFAFGPGYWNQLFSIIGTVIISYSITIPNQSWNITKWVYRSFYPVHLSILFLVILIIK
ncbi:hypothetical protein BK120_23535 [Paenibacillus sp. FSL A5-0031]|nr:hypothetical protein BK120_23535 [Paenibacillus sp. FSL A5-0031]